MVLSGVGNGKIVADGVVVVQVGAGKVGLYFVWEQSVFVPQVLSVGAAARRRVLAKFSHFCFGLGGCVKVIVVQN